MPGVAYVIDKQIREGTILDFPLMDSHSRPAQVILISEPVDRDRWLAGEIDSVEVHATTGSTCYGAVDQILASIVRVLLTTLTTLVTIVLTNWAT